MKITITIIILCIATFVRAQDGVFSVSTDSDLISLDNALKVSFVIENLDGRFEPPSFDDFVVISGPNTSTSMQIINGDVTKKSSYTFLLKPKKEGDLYITEAYLNMKDTVLTTSPIKIQVTSNTIKSNKTEGISQKIIYGEGDKGDITIKKSEPKKKRKIIKL